MITFEIAVEREEDGRRLAEVLELPGVIVACMHAKRDPRWPTMFDSMSA